MARTLEEVEKEIEQLSLEDRQILLDHLLSEKDLTDRAWLEEADRRWHEIESGRVKTIPGHVVRSEIRALIRE